LLNTVSVLIEQYQISWGECSIISCGSFLILEVVQESVISIEKALDDLETLIRLPIIKIDNLQAGFGETVVLVSNTWEPIGEMVFQEDIETNSLFGPFKFIKTANDEQRHVYAFNTALQTGDGFKGLQKLIPHFDRRIFIHNSKMRYIRQRTNLITTEADKIGLMVSNILQNRFRANNEQLLTEILETEIEQLSLNYGVLASYFRLLREGQGILDSSLLRVIGEARKIFGKKVETNLQEYLTLCRKAAKEVQQASEQVNLIMNEVKAAIEVIQTQVNLLRSKESVELQRQFKMVMDQNVALQQKSLTLQVAAGFVEFIVIAYYSFSLWKNLSNAEIFHRVPGLLTLLVASLFAGVSVLCTHLLAHERRLTKKLALAIFSILTLLALMAILSSGLIF